jgi:hypothetical protein
MVNGSGPGGQTWLALTELCLAALRSLVSLYGAGRTLSGSDSRRPSEAAVLITLSVVNAHESAIPY